MTQLKKKVAKTYKLSSFPKVYFSDLYRIRFKGEYILI